MPAKHVVLLNNRIRFSTTQPVSVEKVIESLQGMDYIVRHHFPKAIKNLTGAKVESVELLVTGIEDGSVVEDTVIQLVFGSKAQLEKFVGSIRSKFVSKNDAGETVVKGWVAGSLLVGIAIVGVAYWQATHKPATTAGGLVTVNGDNNVIITIGAESYQTDPQQFQEALEKAVSRTRPVRAAKAAEQLLAPAKGEDGAGVSLESGSHRVEIASPSTVRKIPAIERKDTSEDTSYRRVRVNLRAQDYDSDKRGWAGTIDGLVATRTRVVFANPNDSAKAVYKPSIDADVTVTFSDSARTKPKLIIVERVY